LTFYTRASASNEAGWFGLCRATAVDVSFDKEGTVTSLNQRTTVGWLGALTREKVGSGAAGADISAQYKAFDERCRALPTTRQFVAAFGPLDGERALIAVALVHDSMGRGGPIRVTCAVDFFSHRPCGTAADLRALADDVTVAKVTGIERIDPRTGLFVTGGAADSGCYRVSLAQPFGSSDQINLCTGYEHAAYRNSPLSHVIASSTDVARQAAIALRAQTRSGLALGFRPLPQTPMMPKAARSFA
jgi:hypothetical protein